MLFCCLARELAWEGVAPHSWHSQFWNTKRAKSKNRMQITELSARLSQQSVFWGKYRECRRSFCFTSVLGTPAFALQEIFKIIHHSSLFVWVLSESWCHSRASLLYSTFSTLSSRRANLWTVPYTIIQYTKRWLLPSRVCLSWKVRADYVGGIRTIGLQPRKIHSCWVRQVGDTW